MSEQQRSLYDPLGQQQKQEPWEAQNADDKGVPEVQTQSDTGESGREIDEPQRQKSQRGVAQQPQGGFQRRTKMRSSATRRKLASKATRSF